MLNFLEMKLKLLQHNEEERFYKEYFLAKKDPEKLKSFIKEFKENNENNDLWIPELLPSQANYCFEEVFIKDINKNIEVRKHNRYTPLFNHSHAFFEMIYVLDGNAENIIDGLTINMKAGDICILSPEVTHAIGVYNDNSIIINFLIRKSTFKENFSGQISDDTVLSHFFTRIFYSDEKNSYIMFHTEDDDMLHNLMDYLIWEGLNYTEFSKSIMENLLRATFCYLLKNHKDDVEVSKTVSASTDVVAILSYMQNNYQTISLESLAKHFNYSTSHLSRMIKKHTGTTFAKILQDFKLKKGCSLLAGSNLSVKEISDFVGYESVEYFTRIFKQVYNMTPIDYRHQKVKNITK